VAAAAWIVSEWLRSQMFTGYAWNPLGTIWLPAGGIAGAARFVGTYALSGLAVLSAAALLVALQRRWRFAGAVAVLLGGLALFGRPPLPVPAPDAPLVRIVQPGIGQDERGEDDSEKLLRALTRLSGSPGPRPRMILWPEGVVRPLVEDGYPSQYYHYQNATGHSVRRRIANVLGPDDFLLFGGSALQFDREDNIVSATNSVFALDWNARLTSRYDKSHLVPYGEYLPMRGLLEPLGLARLVPGDIDYADGPGPRALTVPGFGAVGLQICYEIIFSGQVVDRANRPRLLFNPSNDAWFGSWGPPQHLAQSRMRAIEEGLPVLRSTPTGITAAIGADGQVLGRLPTMHAAALELPLPAPAAPTLFSLAGNRMAALVVLLLVAGAIAIRRRGR
jgi:apolipoprotein N-acyltransferase